MAVLFYTSRTDRPPRYHLLYALLAFVGSILVIYIVAQEVVCLLVTLGLVLKLSKSMLGLSVLAWGNSIGDLFSNITLAKRGYAKMAFAACLGGPLFSKTLLIDQYSSSDHELKYLHFRSLPRSWHHYDFEGFGSGRPRRLCKYSPNLRLAWNHSNRKFSPTVSRRSHGRKLRMVPHSAPVYTPVRAGVVRLPGSSKYRRHHDHHLCHIFPFLPAGGAGSDSPIRDGSRRRISLMKRKLTSGHFSIKCAFS